MTDTMLKIREVVKLYRQEDLSPVNALQSIAAILSAPEAEAPVAAEARRIVVREDEAAQWRDTRKVPQHHGDCFGVTVSKREGAGDLIELFVEDDEFWHFVSGFDVHWLPELIRVLSLASPPKAATPPAVVGLTDAEIEAIYDDIKTKGWSLDFARAIERAVWAKAGITQPGGGQS